MQRQTCKKLKKKYFIRSLPKNYRRKFTLTNETTVDTLYEKIKVDLTLWSYIDDWNSDSESEKDNPMDLDFAGKIDKDKPK